MQAPLTQDQQKLVENHVRLAHWVANKYRPAHHPDNENLVSAALFSMVRAVATFDANKGNFATYALSGMRRACVRELKAGASVVARPVNGRSASPDESLSEPAHRDDDDGATLLDALQSPGPTVVELLAGHERDAVVQVALVSLSNRDQALLVARSHGQPIAAVAFELGIHSAYAQECMGKALEHLERALEPCQEDLGWCSGR